ncbi:MAG: hypothetical protein R3D29_03870 [Nitratireductor sp.]
MVIDIELLDIFSVVEVEGLDRTGLLFEITRTRRSQSQYRFGPYRHLREKVTLIHSRYRSRRPQNNRAGAAGKITAGTSLAILDPSIDTPVKIAANPPDPATFCRKLSYPWA